jgi:hypothetical protein
MAITKNTRVTCPATGATGTVTDLFDASAGVTWDIGTMCEVPLDMIVVALSDGDFVRHQNWIGDAVCTIGTARGFATKYGNDPQKAHDNAVKRNQETAWTVYVGATVMADGPAKDAHYARKAAERLRAVTLAEGETVAIEGDLFTVRYVSGNTGQFPRNCDPIHFNPIQNEEAA